jgi:hypothetical protein
MKRVILLLTAVVLIPIGIVAQETKLSGSFKFFSSTVGMVGAAIFSETPSVSGSITMKRADWQLSFTRTSDLVDKATTANQTILSSFYAFKVKNWIFTPATNLFLYDHSNNQLFLMGTVAYQKKSWKAEIMPFYVNTFGGNTVAGLRGIVGTTIQGFNLQLYGWEKKPENGKSISIGAIQVGRKIAQFNGISLLMETSYFITSNGKLFGIGGIIISY